MNRILTAEELKRIRKVKGMSQKSFAEWLGYSKRYIEKIENNEVELTYKFSQNVMRRIDLERAYREACKNYCEVHEAMKKKPFMTKRGVLCLIILVLIFVLLYKRKENEMGMSWQELVELLKKKLEEIKEWNAETFPDATPEGQLAKLDEEFGELDEAKTMEEREKELADIFIVLGGLLRWGSRLANYVLNNLLDKMPNEILEKLLKAIDAKMEVNKERTRKGLWKKQPDGSYHH